MSDHTVEEMNPDTAAQLQGAASEGLDVLGLDAGASADDIVEAIDAFVFNWQRGDRPSGLAVDEEDLPFALGSLWGEQLNRAFGWQWQIVTFHQHGNTVAPGVLTPDHAFAIYPIHFLIGCLQNPDVDATVALSFNMLRESKIPGGEAGACDNLMERVHRIIPR